MWIYSSSWFYAISSPKSNVFAPQLNLIVPKKSRLFKKVLILVSCLLHNIFLPLMLIVNCYVDSIRLLFINFSVIKTANTEFFI